MQWTSCTVSIKACFPRTRDEIDFKLQSQSLGKSESPADLLRANVVLHFFGCVFQQNLFGPGPERDGKVHLILASVKKNPVKNTTPGMVQREICPRVRHPNAILERFLVIAPSR